MSNRRFEMYEIRQVIQRLRLGESDRDVARAQRVGRKTVARVRRQANERGWLDSKTPLPEDGELAQVFAPAPTNRSVSSAAPFREQILAWHGQGITATAIQQALARKYRFTGSVHTIYRLLDRAVDLDPPATMILDFAVAEAAQVDFGQGPQIVDRATGEVLKTWFFVMTLAWSRHQYAEFVRNQKVETWLACHRHAFEWFNGVPGRLIIDNAKCAITRACYYEPTVQRAYGDLALGYGFRIDACPPRDPRKKGRVEAGVKYVKSSFLPLREFHSLAHANAELRAWVLGEAGNRIHGTTRARPLTLFTETEQALLKPLPTIAPECPVWAQVRVHGNAHVQYEYCHYSVPFRLIRHSLWLAATASVVRLYEDHALVATHARLTKPGSHATVPDHMPPDAQAYALRDPQWCLKSAQAIGPACRAVVEALFADRVLEHLRAAQGLLRLADQYGATRLEAACARAVHFGTPRYRTVKSILVQGLDRVSAQAEAEALEDPYVRGGRFSRSSSESVH